ncbi:MAG: response regulator transcription factor [Chloroflexota bacterium]|nr:response regulator transcription factor [Chloroflexota bacterium]
MKRGTRILVVEDDPSISRLLELELTHRGAMVETVADGSRAFEAIGRFNPAVIVLDIMLPGMGGDQILAALRRSGNRTPVLMLTAREATRDKIGALDTGADDYLTKPFEIGELYARLNAILRRVEGEEIHRVGDLEIFSDQRLVRRGDREIELTAREFALLDYLVQNTGRVLTRDQILARVWGDEADTNVVDVYVGYLRRKIDEPGQERLIQTVRGVGFVIRSALGA